MARTDNIPLPSKKELSRILAREASRPLPAGKEAIHYPDFRPVIALFEAYDIPTDVFTDDALDIHGVVTKGALLLEAAVPKMLAATPARPRRKLFDDAYTYLSEEDQPQPSDLLFVFGARTLSRPQKAAELYAAGFAETIIVSGGGPIYGDGRDGSEASDYRDHLIMLGTPRNAVLTEDASITIPDNVRRTLNMLDDIGRKYESMILVNSPYAQRRGWCIFRKYLPDTIRIYRANSEVAEQANKLNWHKQEDTLRIVLNEFIKMRASVVYNAA